MEKEFGNEGYFRVKIYSNTMPVEYLIKAERSPNALVFSSGKKIADLFHTEKKKFRMVTIDQDEWDITREVQNKVLPFSLTMNKLRSDVKGIIMKQFLVKEHLFMFNNNIYMFINHPEGKHWKEYLSGPRHIARLDNPPLDDLTSVETTLKHNLKRYRETSVGTAYGIGIFEHRVILSSEIEPIGLFVAVSSYILYAMV